MYTYSTKIKVTKGLQSWEIFRIGIGLFGADPVHPRIFETAVLENPVQLHHALICRIILHIIHVAYTYIYIRIYIMYIGL